MYPLYSHDCVSWKKVETSETVFAFFIKPSEKYSGDVFVTSVSNAPCGGVLNRKKTLVLNCENDLVKNLAYEKHKTFSLF